MSKHTEPNFTEFELFILNNLSVRSLYVAETTPVVVKTTAGTLHNSRYVTQHVCTMENNVRRPRKKIITFRPINKINIILVKGSFPP